MSEEILTHGGTDTRFKLCRCFACKKVERCTPQHDFYTKSSDGPKGPLYCQPCLLSGEPSLAEIGGSPIGESV
jgi:hypothetical protein